MKQIPAERRARTAHTAGVQATLVLVGKVVNLNKFRKRKAKVDREKKAETNRRLHGRTKLERQRDELQKERLTRGLHGKKLEKGSDTEGDV
jgi:hypothetical protein